MLPVFKVIGWSLTGALSAWILLFAGILLYARVFDPSEAADIRSWQTFSAVMGGLGGALVGLVLGAIYGVVRARKVTGPPPN